MPPRGGGRPVKAKRNISGLRNQKPRSPSPEPEPSRLPEPDWPSDLDAARGKSGGEQNLANADGMKFAAGSESDIGIDSDIGVEDGDNVLTHATESLEKEALSAQLLGQVEDMGDHAQVPTRACYQRQRTKLERTARGEYKKGPDVASKSDRTRRRYKKSIVSQSTLQAGSHFVVLPSLPRPVRKTPSLFDGSVMSGIEEQPQDTVDDKA